MDEKYLELSPIVKAIEEESRTKSWHAPPLLHRRQHLRRDEPDVIEIVEVEHL
jgi:hypothetical protein